MIPMSAPSLYEPDYAALEEFERYDNEQQELEEERQQHILGMLKKVSQGMGTLNLAEALAAEFGLSHEWRQYAGRND
jgi:hypothetical protein